MAYAKVGVAKAVLTMTSWLGQGEAKKAKQAEGSCVDASQVLPPLDMLCDIVDLRAVWVESS